VSYPRTHFESKEDVKSLIRAFEAANRGKGRLKGKIVLDTIKVRALGVIPHRELTVYPAESSNPKPALKGVRKVFWDSASVDTPLYEQGNLRFGNVVSGPAIVESEYTTILIPKGQKYSVDKFLFGVIEKERKDH
jgi:N-methylhydantoinase A/oxoprolinase/acetone carboxylase beta subunit